MKKLLFFIAVITLAWSCNSGGSGSGATGGPVKLASFIDSASYTQGLLMGEQISGMQVEGEDPLINPDLLAAGLKAALAGEEGLISEGDKMKVMQQFQTFLMTTSQRKAEAEGKINREKGQAFLAENASKEGVITTASGLQYKVLREGTGAQPTTKDIVQVNYEGRLINGEVFDSSYERGTPAKFAITGVIRGWTEALQLMKVGSKYQLYIPDNLAYGNQGSPPNIGAGETLIFDVELLKINPDAQ